MHQRKNTRRRIGNAAMTAFATSMLSTIIISLMMIWLLTNGEKLSRSDQDGGATKPKMIMKAS
jgi:hypothetical protein